VTQRKKKAKPVFVEPENTHAAAASSVPRVTIAFSAHDGASSSPPRRIQMPTTCARTQTSASGTV
jgi:hypothetical protein